MPHKSAVWTGWALVTALCVLSLWPGGVETPAEIGGARRHALAYAITGAVLGFAHGSLRGRLATAGGLVALGFALELAQTLAPGRTPQLADAWGSAVGALSGVFAVSVVALRRRRDHLARPHSGDGASPER